jgi:hypothetical protein
LAKIVLELGLFAPRQANEHVQIVAHHRGFGRHGRHEFEFFQLALGFFAGLGRHLGSLDFLFELLDVRALFAIAQLFLDGLDLLVQVEVALVLFHLALHAATNALVHVQDINLVLQLLEKIFQA